MNGEMSAPKLSLFLKEGKRVAIFHLTANICGVKVNFCQNVKTEERRRKLFVPFC